MVGEPITVRVQPSSELDRALAESGDREVFLERDGLQYRVEPVPHLADPDEEDIWGSYDPDAIRRDLKAYAGLWHDIDAEAMKEYIYQGREEGTRPSDTSNGLGNS